MFLEKFTTLIDFLYTFRLFQGSSHPDPFINSLALLAFTSKAKRMTVNNKTRYRSNLSCLIITGLYLIISCSLLRAYALF
jgi:hypothetical protein